MIVSNTSTLILLAKANSLYILLDYIKKISIPKIVYNEIFDKKDSFEVLSIIKEIKKKRIVLVDVDEKSYSSVLNQFKLDKGEAAAYALLKKIKGKAILTDDGELIKLCKIENIPFINAMAVIVKLFKKKKLAKEDALEKLEKLYGYGRYSKDIYDYFKSEVKWKMETISIRLKKVKELDYFGKLLKENRSELIRDLLEEGKKMKAINLYKNKKISLGLAARFADMSISDFLDLLEEYNVKLNLTLEDAKLAMKHAEKIL